MRLSTIRELMFIKIVLFFLTQSHKVAKRFLISPLCAFASLCLIYPQLCNGNSCEEVSTWNIGSAISYALQTNRNLITQCEAVQRADLNLEYEMTDFEWKVDPNSRLAMVGEGKDKGFSTGIGVNLSKKWECGTKVFLSPFINRIKKNANVSLRALISQPLFRGIGYWYNTARIQGANYQYRTALRNLHIGRMKLIVRVINAMYEIVKQEEIVLLNKQSFERLSGYLRAAKLKEKIGFSDSLDVFRAETELRHAEDNLTSAQERLQESYDVFRELLFLPMEQPVKVEVPVEYGSIECQTEEAITTGLQYRTEMEQAQDNIYEQKRIVAWANQNLLPDLNLVYEYQTWRNRLLCQYYTNENEPPLYSYYDWNKRESNWSFGFNSSSDLYQYSEKLFYQNSLLSLDAAYRNMEQTEVTITLEIKRALRTLKQARKRLELQEEQIQTAEGELYLSQIKFDRGLANNFDVIQAERNLRTAHIAYLSAMIEHINGEYQLKLALGILADKPCL